MHMYIGAPASVPPTVGNITSAGSITSSASLTKPAVSAGDMIVIAVGYYSSYSATPSGYTLINRRSTSNKSGVAAFYRIADGSEGSTISLTGFDADGVVSAVGIQVKGAGSIDTSATGGNTSNSTTQPAPTITTAGSNRLGILLATGDPSSTSGAYSWPAGVAEIGTYNSPNNDGYQRIGVATIPLSAAGSQGPWTVTAPATPTNGWASMSIAISPA